MKAGAILRINLLVRYIALGFFIWFILNEARNERIDDGISLGSVVFAISGIVYIITFIRDYFYSRGRLECVNLALIGCLCVPWVLLLGSGVFVHYGFNASLMIIVGLVLVPVTVLILFSSIVVDFLRYKALKKAGNS
jgi:hypothetical protein